MNRPPLNPHAFDEIKLAEERSQKAVDRLFGYQTETRQRVDTLIKAIFVLSGGALTISIGIFLRNEAPQLNPGLVVLLKFSWGLIFYSLVASAFVLFSMVCQGYYFAALWGRAFNSNKNEIGTSFPLRLSIFANWFIGVTGFLAFLVGIGALACVSIGAIKP